MEITALRVAKKWVGTKEVPGVLANPAIVVMLGLVGQKPSDEIPWCSAFVAFICWLLDLPRAYSARARTWLLVGTAITLEEAKPGFDVVIFNRGGSADPAVVDGPGHVAFFCGLTGDRVQVLGGNQGNAVRLASFPVSEVLGVRRLAEA